MSVHPPLLNRYIRRRIREKATAEPTDKAEGKPGLQVTSEGAEYDGFAWKVGDSRSELSLGDRFRIMHESGHARQQFRPVLRWEGAADVWPIMGRAGAPKPCMAGPSPGLLDKILRYYARIAYLLFGQLLFGTQQWADFSIRSLSQKRREFQRRISKSHG